MSLKALFLSTLLSALPSLSHANETVLGAFIFSRHGDRTAKAWPPTSLTALGADEVYISGSYYRARYVAANASSAIRGLSNDLVVDGQLSISSPSGDVLENSATVFAQALYPPAGSAARETLRNGSVVEAPLGGYQYIPVGPVSKSLTGPNSESTKWLQGDSGCGNAIVSSNEYFSSQQYLDTLKSTEAFYQGLLPVINGTFDSSEANFKNAYSIFDLINVAEIHNATIPADNLLTNSTLLQLRARANQHEWGLAYNASEPVRAIAGAVLAGQVVASLNSSLTDPLSQSRLAVQFGSYGTFLSFFGLAGLPQVSADFTGVCDYASAMVFELVTNATVPPGQQPSPADVGVRFLFANGSASAANEPRAYPLFGGDSTLLPWGDFVSGMNKFAIADTGSWCAQCGNSTGSCAAAAAAGGSSSSSSSSSSSGSGSSGSGDGGVTRPVAGVIGALVTLVVILAVEGLVMAAAGLRLVKKGAKDSAKAAREGSAAATNL